MLGVRPGGGAHNGVGHLPETLHLPPRLTRANSSTRNGLASLQRNESPWAGAIASPMTSSKSEPGRQEQGIGAGQSKRLAVQLRRARQCSPAIETVLDAEVPRFLQQQQQGGQGVRFARARELAAAGGPWHKSRGPAGSTAGPAGQLAY